MTAQSDIFVTWKFISFPTTPPLPNKIINMLLACLSISRSVGQAVSFLVFSTHSCWFIASFDAKFLCFLTLSTFFSHFTSGLSHHCLPPCDQVIICIGQPPCVLYVHTTSTYGFPLLPQLFVSAPFLSDYFNYFF